MSSPTRRRRPMFRRWVSISSVVALTSGMLGVGAVATSATAAAVAAPTGAAVTWGSNASGELGDGTMVGISRIPVAVDTSGVLNGESVVQISGTSSTFCVLTETAKVFCWGAGYQGQLGDGTDLASAVPVAVDLTGALAGKTVTQISTIANSSCALTSDGLVFCWGDNYFGQLGRGTVDDTSAVPVAVDVSGVLAGRTVTALSSGGFATQCAILDNASIACWGAGSSGQMGNGTFAQNNPNPVLVDTSGVLNGTTPIAVSAGSSHICALTSDATAACWGGNNRGQLGNGTLTSSLTPVLVDTGGALAGQDLAVLQAGGDSTCALTTTGTGYCWGENNIGQLGNGTQTNAATPTPVDASGILAGEPLASISVSSSTGCATTVSGRAACWGDNDYGQLGDGGSDRELSPVWVDDAGVLATAYVEQVAAAYYTTASWGRAADGCPSPSEPMRLGGVYQLGTSAHLEWLRDDSTLWDDSFALVGDIDVEGCTWSTTIGDDTTPFTGEFDGGGHAITNIDIEMSSAVTVSVGLFGSLGDGHVVRDLHVSGDVSGTSLGTTWEVQVGGVAGYATGGVIERVTFQGSVTATQATAHASAVFAGGLVGVLADDTITESGVLNTTVMAAKGDPHAGGLIGKALGGSGSGTQTWVTDSFAFSSVVTAQDQAGSGGSFAGGLLGAMEDGVGDVVVSDGFARGSVTVRNALAAGSRGNAGGVVGIARIGSIDNTYADVVLESVDPQGFDRVGRIAGTVTSEPTGGANFWDADRAGPATAFGFDGGATLTGTGVSESAMRTMSTFADAGWLIVDTYQAPGPNVWGICEGQSLPYLLWQAATLPVPGSPCSAPPTISGSPTVGQTLTASMSTPLSNIAYRWWRIDGEGNEVPLTFYDDTYVVSVDDIGSRLMVEGTANRNGIATVAFSSPTTVVPDPSPRPPSPIPASPPREVTGVSGNRSVVVSWLPPASSGSFRITTYEVWMDEVPTDEVPTDEVPTDEVPTDVSQQVCLVPASSDDTTSCVVEDLINGRPYEFRVRALTGAGWGAFSEPSEPVVPRPPSIVITGSRNGGQVQVVGEAPELIGAEVTPWLRFPGPHRYAPGEGVRVVDDQGQFTWQRSTNKRVYVYFRAADNVRSNRVIIPAR